MDPHLPAMHLLRTVRDHRFALDRQGLTRRIVDSGSFSGAISVPLL